MLMHQLSYWAYYYIILIIIIILLLLQIIEVCFLMISHIWLIPDPLDEVKIDADSDLVYQFPVISLLGFP